MKTIKSKKTVSKAKASVSKKMTAADMKNAVKHHSYLIVLLAVFAGFSLYSIFSFFGSTGNYINGLYGSVLHEGELEVVEEVISYDVFTDVASDSIHAVAIEKLRDFGVFGGYNDGSFKPDKIITRSEVLSILTTAIDVDFAGASLGNCFGDVKNEWFSVAVCYAKKQGWVTGKNENFGPREAVGYSEALKTTVLAFGFPVATNIEVEPVPGVSIDAWYAPYFKTALDYGLIDVDFNFDSTNKLTRAEFAEFVYRAMKVKKLF